MLNVILSTPYGVERLCTFYFYIWEYISPLISIKDMKLVMLTYATHIPYTVQIKK